MTETSSWLIGLLLLAALLGGVILWSSWQRTRRRVALFVLNGAKTVLKGKSTVLAELLRCRLAARGLPALRAKNPAVTALLNDKPACDIAAVNYARSLGVDYAMVVSMDDLSCQVDESRIVSILDLRVNTTLCVAYQILEISSGRLLAGQTLALCRRTSPIVSGTNVGSDILDQLLREVADRISEHLGSLRLAS